MPQLTAQQSHFLTSFLGTPLVPPDNGAPRVVPVTPEENARLAALSAEELATTKLTQCDVKDLFKHDYMQGVRTAEFRGEGDPKLKDLMRVIIKGVAGAECIQTMIGLAGIVGIPPTAERLEVDYERFLVVRKQQEAIGKDCEEVPPLDEDKHPDFMASRGQLMFGKVLGDAFGIHEVFASLLSPTGGLVGPGNKFAGPIDAFHLSADNPIALHGTVHDAAGYMLNYHEEGPGYNYRDSWVEPFGTNNPLAGQISGIAYWTAQAGPEYVVTRVDAAVIEVEKALKSVCDAVTGVIDNMLAEFLSKAGQGDNVIEAGDKELDVAEAIADAANKAKDATTEAYDTASDAVTDTLSEEAGKKMDAMSKFIWRR